jgi:dolichol-phosphate mannosyltransferase
VLNEASRITACLETLIAQPAQAAEILVVDGGSSDGTQSIVERYHARDPRVRLIDASPVPESWCGKAWGLHVGLQNTAEQSDWILCVDADVRCSPLLVTSLLDHAKRTHIAAFSVATSQSLEGTAAALLHPALLTTWVYRFGMPGKATRNLHAVQANGQCFFARRDTLIRTAAVEAGQKSLCEDVTMARHLTEHGEAVGCYEANGLVRVTMYSNLQETWQNWPRSLPTRDQYFGWREVTGLIEVLLVQALPLPFIVLCGFMTSLPAGFSIINQFLLIMRLGVLFGVSRAYEPRPWSYWFSPLLDLPVAVRLIVSALRRRQSWRGRVYLRQPGGIFEPVKTSPSPS